MPEVRLVHIFIQPVTLRHGHGVLLQVVRARVQLDRRLLRLHLAPVAQVAPPELRLLHHLHTHHLDGPQGRAAGHLAVGRGVARADRRVHPLGDPAEGLRALREVVAHRSAGLPRGRHPVVWLVREVQPGVRLDVPHVSREWLSQWHTPPPHPAAAEGIFHVVLAQANQVHKVFLASGDGHLARCISGAHGSFQLPLDLGRVRLPVWCCFPALAVVPLPEDPEGGSLARAATGGHLRHLPEVQDPSTEADRRLAACPRSRDLRIVLR
mmetsp:Transcript_94928/g.268336  ORF Transcript_94928/g.268336 Transcript_94928/m.268336 type:complete len:267 (+) Transcript_94928:767-1567(+)